MGIKPKNPFLKKDTRYLIRVTDEKMAREMQKTIAREGLTQQEYLDKYVKPHLPREEFDIPHRYYEEFTKQFLIICHPSRTKNVVQEIIALIWVILLRIYRSELDAEKLKNRLEQIIHDDALRPDRPPHILDTIQLIKDDTELK